MSDTEVDYPKRPDCPVCGGSEYAPCSECAVAELRRVREQRDMLTEAARSAAKLASALMEIRQCYTRHILNKGLTFDMIDPDTLEGEVWAVLDRKG